MEDNYRTAKSEEIANAITHGVGVILSLIAIIVLIYQSIVKGSVCHVVCCSFYGASLLILYTNSTIYHALTHKTAKSVFRRLDHISIYLLIFGTYIPLTVIALNSAFGWTLFGIECALCVLGITFKAIFGPRLSVLSALFYLMMGWLAVFIFKPICLSISAKGLFWILLGGVFYTLGIGFFAADKKVPYFHAIWHIFVVLGSICHFITILYYVIPCSY